MNELPQYRQQRRPSRSGQQRARPVQGVAGAPMLQLLPLLWYLFIAVICLMLYIILYLI